MSFSLLEWARRVWWLWTAGDGASSFLRLDWLYDGFTSRTVGVQEIVCLGLLEIMRTLDRPLRGPLSGPLQ
jgi:hypothetical protein